MGTVYQIPVKGYFAENCYFYLDNTTKQGFVIDPGAQGRELLALICREGWTIKAVLLTHGHFDHTGAVNELRSALGCPVYAHERAEEYLLDAQKNLSALCGPPILVEETLPLTDGDVVEAEPLSLQVIYTPGHTTDSVVYYSEKDGVAFVGDTIFKGSMGEYRYPGGNLERLLQSIRSRILSLPENTVLYSGHSAPTTVGAEEYRYLTKR